MYFRLGGVTDSCPSHRRLFPFAHSPPSEYHRSAYQATGSAKTANYELLFSPRSLYLNHLLACEGHMIRLCRCGSLLGHPDASDVRSIPFPRDSDSLVLRQGGSCEPSFSIAHTDSISAVAPASQVECDPAGDCTASHADAPSDGTMACSSTESIQSMGVWTSLGLGVIRPDRLQLPQRVLINRMARDGRGMPSRST